MKENKYILTLKEGEQLARLPGDLNGKDFLIDSLKDCVVHVLDHTAQIQVMGHTDLARFSPGLGESYVTRRCHSSVHPLPSTLSILFYVEVYEISWVCARRRERALSDGVRCA